MAWAGSRPGERTATVSLLVGAGIAAPLEVGYLWPALPYGLPQLILALAILLWPLRRLPATPRQALRTAAWWAGLGLLGAYLFGVMVLVASLAPLIGGLVGRRQERRTAAGHSPSAVD
jgi:hypothetical protein